MIQQKQKHEAGSIEDPKHNRDVVTGKPSILVRETVIDSFPSIRAAVKHERCSQNIPGIVVRVNVSFPRSKNNSTAETRDSIIRLEDHYGEKG